MLCLPIYNIPTFVQCFCLFLGVLFLFLLWVLIHVHKPSNKDGIRYSGLPLLGHLSFCSFYRGSLGLHDHRWECIGHKIIDIMKNYPQMYSIC